MTGWCQIAVSKKCHQRWVTFSKRPKKMSRGPTEFSHFFGGARLLLVFGISDKRGCQLALEYHGFGQLESNLSSLNGIIIAINDLLLKPRKKHQLELSLEQQPMHEHHIKDLETNDPLDDRVLICQNHHNKCKSINNMMHVHHISTMFACDVKRLL